MSYAAWKSINSWNSSIFRSQNLSSVFLMVKIWSIFGTSPSKSSFVFLLFPQHKVLILNVRVKYLPVWLLCNYRTSSHHLPYGLDIQGESFCTRPKKMRISQRLFIRLWICIYDYTPCFMKSMSILEEILEMFATTVQAELNATLGVCESGLQDVLTNRSNFTSNVLFQFLYGAWLVGISFSF